MNPHVGANTNTDWTTSILDALIPVFKEIERAKGIAYLNCYFYSTSPSIGFTLQTYKREFEDNNNAPPTIKKISPTNREQYTNTVTKMMKDDPKKVLVRGYTMHPGIPDIVICVENVMCAETRTKVKRRIYDCLFEKGIGTY